MTKALTAAAIEKMKPGPARREIADGLLTGLYLVIQPSGRKSWAVRYRLGKRSCKYTIGPIAAYGLADARKAAKAALQAVSEGRDPAAARHVAEASSAEAITVADACAQFVLRYCRAKKRRSWRDTARRLGLKPSAENEEQLDRTGKGVVRDWGSRLIRDIKRRDVLVRLDTIVAAGHPISANLELATLRKFCGWLVEKEILADNPCAKIKRPSESADRDRVLSDVELKQVWQAAETLGWPFGRLVQLLILTGQRRNEVAQMRWSEIDLEGRTWTIPRNRRKNDKAQIVPLSPAALAIIAGLPHVKSSAGFVFTTTGDSPISGYSKWKAKLDTVISDAGNKLPGWTLRDLRRTLATGLQKLGTRLEVTEAVLGHTSGSRAGIIGVYQRFDWAPEKRAALDGWAKHVLGVIEQGNVIHLKAAHSRASRLYIGVGLWPIFGNVGGSCCYDAY